MKYGNCAIEIMFNTTPCFGKVLKAHCAGFDMTVIYGLINQEVCLEIRSIREGLTT